MEANNLKPDPQKDEANTSPESATPRLTKLSATKLEALLDAALDFQSAAELENWLKKNS
jgi:hypothetical protein